MENTEQRHENIKEAIRGAGLLFYGFPYDDISLAVFNQAIRLNFLKLLYPDKNVNKLDFVPPFIVSNLEFNSDVLSGTFFYQGRTTTIPPFEVDYDYTLDNFPELSTEVVQ